MLGSEKLKVSHLHPVASACAALILSAASSGAIAGDKPQVGVESTTDVAAFGSLYVDTTLTVAPTSSLYDQGLRLRFTASYDRYRLTDPKRTASDKAAEALLGYVFTFQRASILIAGGAAYTEKVEGGIPGSDTKTGGKILISTYARPSDKTMLFAQASYNSATDLKFAQGKFGMLVMPSLYMGPEASITSGRDFTQARFGLHLTGFSVGKINGGISAGALRDSNNGTGAYSSLTIRADI